MARYFYDAEFLEGTQKSFFGQSKPTIDLISIGIVAEDGREYYAISKDFNLKEAWNRYDVKTEQVSGDMRNHFPEGKKTKVYWIRENVLRPIWRDLVRQHNHKVTRLGLTINHKDEKEFTYSNLKSLITAYGKTNKQIAKEVCAFIDARGDKNNPSSWLYPSDGSEYPKKVFTKNVELYGYYSAYDHVALCWLFGKMIDLPKGFPMYTIDLKQELDKKSNEMIDRITYESGNHTIWDLGYALKEIKKLDGYPKQTNEHNALSDAKWNFELYKFIHRL